MTTLTLYRGISLSPSRKADVIERIRSTGLVGDEGRMKVNFVNLELARSRLARSTLNAVPAIEDLWGDDSPYGVYASGALDGAVYYAKVHNRTSERTCPIVVKFESSIFDTYVDARDFLCTAFQLWDRSGTAALERQRSVLRLLFGESVLRYFDHATSTRETTVRIAMCNLAAFDLNVAVEHVQNRRLMEGRYGTVFPSAFVARAPVPASRILDVVDATDLSYSRPAITISQYLDGATGSLEV